EERSRTGGMCGLAACCPSARRAETRSRIGRCGWAARPNDRFGGLCVLSRRRRTGRRIDPETARAAGGRIRVRGPFAGPASALRLVVLPRARPRAGRPGPTGRHVTAPRGPLTDHWGVAKLVKAPDFDSGIRGFESFLP